MKKAILLPRRFVLGRGVISEVGDYAAIIGDRVVVLWGAHTKAAVGDAVLASLDKAGVSVVDVHFNGESTKAEAERVAELARGTAAIIGIGGGKAVDTAKAAAILAKVAQIVVPTVASNDSAPSACTVWYDEAGTMIGFDLWPANPDYILVDTEVVANAPQRLFVAGLGDAFATWFEADANYQSRAVTCSGGGATLTAMAMAELCRDTIFDYGLQAIADVGVHAATPAVEKVVEATTLLSGIGWESGGLATAHAVGNGLPALPETHHLLHGEKVSFGVVTQVCLDEKLDPDLGKAAVDLLVEAGLPVTFEEVGIADISPQRLRGFAASLAGEGSFIHNHPFSVTADDVYDALVAADARGRAARARLGR